MNTRRAIVTTCCLVLALATGTAYVAHRVEAQQSAPGVMTPSIPQLGDPSGPAHMSRQAVLSVARTEFGSALTAHPLTMQYGSFTDEHLQVRGPSGMVPFGTRNVWMVTVSGMDISRTCDVPASQEGKHPVCPSAHIMVMYIDDTSGKLIEGMAF